MVERKIPIGKNCFIAPEAGKKCQRVCKWGFQGDCDLFDKRVVEEGRKVKLIDPRAGRMNHLGS